MIKRTGKIMYIEKDFQVVGFYEDGKTSRSATWAHESERPDTVKFIDYETFDQLQKQNKELQDKLNKCVEALKFYANEHLWDYNENNGLQDRIIISDTDDSKDQIGGKFARQTLKEIGES